MLYWCFMKMPLISGIIAIAIFALAVWYLMPMTLVENTSGKTESATSSAARNAGGDQGSAARECQARCRDQYGGSGSAGFDACIRGCGAVGAAGGAREAACGNPGPACLYPEF